jgi:hypothetical protein
LIGAHLTPRRYLRTCSRVPDYHLPEVKELFAEIGRRPDSVAMIREYPCHAERAGTHELPLKCVSRYEATMKAPHLYSQRLIVVCLALSLTASLTAGGRPLRAQQAPSGQNTIEVAQGVRVVLPSPWFLAFRTQNSVELIYPPQHPRQELRWTQSAKNEEKPFSGEALVTADARTSIRVETRSSHVEAMTRLAEIASEVPEHPDLIVIAGWPAIERRRVAPLPNPGEAERDLAAPSLSLFTTTAIAADTLVVRFETVFAPAADRELAETAFSLARSVLVTPGDTGSAQHDLETISRLIMQPSTEQR